MIIKNPEHLIEEIDANLLLEKVMEKKNMGRKLSQACAAFVDNKYELSYSFSDDDTLVFETLRIVIEPDVEIPSITEFYPYAFLYENEMKELFGVKIKMIGLDYNNKLYRIDEEAPFKKMKEDK